MITLLVIFSLLLIVILYLLLAPFYIEINTDEGLYRLRFHRLISVRFLIRNSSPVLEIKMAGFRKQIDLLEARKETDKPKATSKRKKKTRLSWKKVIAVFKSFKINKCFVSIDTGDNELNGILYPAFYLVSFYTGKSFRINFINENKIVFETQNSIARMSWAYISS